MIELLPHYPQWTAVVSGRVTAEHKAFGDTLKADVAVVWATHDGKPALVLAELKDAARTPVDSYDNSRLYADLTFAGTPASLIALGDAAPGDETALD